MAASEEDVKTNQAKASMTAVSVATAFMRAMDTGYDYLFSKTDLELCKHLVRTGRQALDGLNGAMFGGLSILPNTWQRYIMDKAVFPGFDLHMLLRKLMVKNKIEQAIADGTKQVVFLGGGYDIRAFIAALQHPGISFFECDRGATRENKLAGLRSIPDGIISDAYTLQETDRGSVSMNTNLHYIECDLSRDDLHARLSQHGFVSTSKTLVIAEGLTMYFNQEANRQLLLRLAAILAEDSEVILSIMSDLDVSKLNDTAVKESNEPLLFALAPQVAVQFMQACGFSVEGKFDTMSRFEELGVTPEREQIEHYYQIRRSTIVLDQFIDEVPAIAFAIPGNPALRGDKSPSSCLLM